MNVFQSIAILIAVQAVVVMLLSGCSAVDLKDIDRVNREVNSYGYQSDEKGKGGMKLMAPGTKGDCEDHAYTKCLALKQVDPTVEAYFLHRVGHVALGVNGQVLDNQSNRLYRYNPDDWTHRIKFNCENFKG